MFQELSNYFFQYKTVCIPGIGTFKIVPGPAMLDVANQQLLPPQPTVLFSQRAELPPHQIETLAPAFDNSAAATEEALERFGEQLKHTLQQRPFAWQGIGELTLAANDIRFTSSPPALAAVPAAKVLRNNVQHSVLVGDNEMLLSADAPTEIEKIKKAAPAMLLGWILLALAAVFIIYHLYTYRGRVAATGLQQKAVVQRTPAQYK